MTIIVTYLNYDTIYSDAYKTKKDTVFDIPY